MARFHVLMACRYSESRDILLLSLKKIHNTVALPAGIQNWIKKTGGHFFLFVLDRLIWYRFGFTLRNKFHQCLPLSLSTRTTWDLPTSDVRGNVLGFSYFSLAFVGHWRRKKNAKIEGDPVLRICRNVFYSEAKIH